MIASWMAYASLVSVALVVAGLAFERIAATRRWPLRWIWLGALVLSVAWPVGAALWPTAPTTPESVAVTPFTIVVRPTQALVARPGGPDRAAMVDNALVCVWCALSGLLILRVIRDIAAIRRRRQTWRGGIVDGTNVRLSTDVGPAVVGLHSMDVVLPEWVLSLDAPLRALILRHEEEHRSAGDPYLLFAATVAVTLMPWNPALWFLTRRLRLAIEMDCDARVLLAYPSPERYGLLILTIAQRQLSAPMPFAPALAEPATHLERRIIAMQTPRRTARTSAYLAAAFAVLVLGVACSLQTGRPTAQAPFDAWMAAQGFQSWTAAQPTPGTPAPRYPEPLVRAKIEGSVLAQFVIDTVGMVDVGTLKVLESTNDAFTASVRAALPTMRFVAPQVNGRKVKQLIQMPFEFSLGNAINTSSSVATDTAHTTTHCDQGNCPVFRLPSLRVSEHDATIPEHL